MCVLDRHIFISKTSLMAQISRKLHRTLYLGLICLLEASVRLLSSLSVVTVWGRTVTCLIRGYFVTSVPIVTEAEVLYIERLPSLFWTNNTRHWRVENLLGLYLNSPLALNVTNKYINETWVEVPFEETTYKSDLQYNINQRRSEDHANAFTIGPRAPR